MNGLAFVIYKANSTAGLVGKEHFIDFSYNVSSVSTRTISGTDANSLNPSAASSGTNTKYYVAYQQSTSSIKYVEWTAGTNFSNLVTATISDGGGYTLNRYPSISQSNGNPVVSWTANTPSITVCAVRRKISGTWTTFYQVGSYMNYTNNNSKYSTGEGAIIGWRNTYTNVTQFVKLENGSYGTINTLSPTGEIQLSDGLNFNNIKAVTFAGSGSAPYALSPLTYNFQTLSKVTDNENLNYGRTAIVSVNGNEFVYYLGDIKVDGQTVYFNSFVDSLKIEGKPDFNGRLSTNSFYLDNASDFQFTNYYYSLLKETNEKVLQGNDKVDFAIELVSASDNKTVGRFREMNYDKKSVSDSSTIEIKVDCNGLKAGEYYLRLVAETELDVELNITDVQYEEYPELKKMQQDELRFDGTEAIDDYELQNYPNPFNPTTIIKYQLPKDGFVTLKVYDILGKEIKTLVNEYKPSGRYEITFDGSSLASGVYVYKLDVNNFSTSRKFILMK